jgi:hypothetical protein
MKHEEVGKKREKAVRKRVERSIVGREGSYFGNLPKTSAFYTLLTLGKPRLTEDQ